MVDVSVAGRARAAAVADRSTICTGRTKRRLHLLRFLSREVRALPLLVLATSRDIVRTPKPAAGALLVVADRRAARAPHVPERPVAGRDRASWSRPRSPRELERADAARAARADRGQPVLRARDGALARDERRAPVAGQPATRLARVELPRRVREVIGLRMQGARRRKRSACSSLASVIGREFSLAVLEQVAELPRAELLGLLEPRRARASCVSRRATPASERRDAARPDSTASSTR